MRGKWWFKELFNEMVYRVERSVIHGQFVVCFRVKSGHCLAVVQPRSVQLCFHGDRVPSSGPGQQQHHHLEQLLW